MIDILSIRQGDIIEYGPYICSESLENERYTGTYQDFSFRSPDERPIEMWIVLKERPGEAYRRLIRASQVTNVYPQEENNN